MKYKLNSAEAFVPERANPTDAGLDLRACADIELLPNEVTWLDTQVSVAIPRNNVGLVFQRSSYTKLNVSLANAVGVIDANYRGSLIVALRNNNSEESVKIRRGDKIAQLVVVPIWVPSALEEYTGNNWVDTDRGTGGFGSTGR